jgi:hypothetical protein
VGSVERKISLTGIKPTGEPHLGNYVGAIVPALQLAETYDSVYFIADYHALTTIRDRQLMRHYTRSVAATWLAAGLNPDRTTFYRQSDVPEIFELSWVLACMSSKGLMNLDPVLDYGPELRISGIVASVGRVHAALRDRRYKDSTTASGLLDEIESFSQRPAAALTA